MINEHTNKDNKIKDFKKNGLFAKLKGASSYLKKDPFIILISIIFIAFSIYWSYESILKLYALSAPINLGLIMESGWMFVNTHSISNYLIMHPIILIIFPLFILKSYTILLSFESFFITLGIFAVYGISKNLLKNNTFSFIIATSYLIFPYIAGIYYFDFLYQSMFVTLFLFGYYFYLKKMFKTSFVLFILSGSSFFIYFIFLIIFSLCILFLNLYRKKWNKEKYENKNMIFSILMLIATLFLFFILNYSALIQNSGISGNLSALILEHGSKLHDIYYKINLLFLLFLPFIVLSLFTRRFMFMFLPLFYVLLFFIITSSYITIIWEYQYVPLIVAYIYLGLIFSLYFVIERYRLPEIIEHKIKFILNFIIYSIDRHRTPNEKVHMHKFNIDVSLPKLKITVLMIILVIIIAIISQPIGIINEYSQKNLDIFENTSANYTKFNNLQNVISLIPSNNSYVLTQYNIPEVYPRPLAYGMPLITGITNFTSNITATKIYINNSGKLIMPRIDYILSDLNSPWYLYGKPNMYYFNSLIYSSGEYGIVAEASGLVLLEKGYSGNIKYYVPEYFSFAPSSLVLGPNTTVHKNIIIANNTNSTLLWSTPLFNLAPGKYNITFSIKTNNTSLKNVLKINLSAFAVPLLTQYYLSGLSIKTCNAWTNVSFSLYIYSFFANITLSCYSLHWNGSLYFKNIAISQVSPSSFSNYVLPHDNIYANITKNTEFLKNNEKIFTMCLQINYFNLYPVTLDKKDMNFIFNIKLPRT